jgi:hypothetical protein
MWIFSPAGFFSIVRKPNDVQRGTLAVRAHLRGTMQRPQREGQR